VTTTNLSGMDDKFIPIYDQVSALFNQGTYDGQRVIGAIWLHGETPSLVVVQNCEPWTKHVPFTEFDTQKVSLVRN